MSRPSAGAGREEIEAVYRRDLAKFQRLATAITGERELGCDAVQEAFARAVHRRLQFRGEGSLEGWLWRIVVRRARDVAARGDSMKLLDEKREASEASVNEMEATALRALIAHLPERQRLVLFLRYYAELEYGAIAEAAGISTGTVGATLNQARENLRRLLVEVPR